MAATGTYYWEKDAGIATMDLPESVPVRRDALEKFSKDLAGVPDIRDMVRGMDEHWETTARAHGDVLLGREQRIELVGELLGLVGESISLYIPLYRLREKLAGAARLACHARIHGWPSAAPHPADVRFWVRTGCGVGALVHERLSRELLSHVAGLLDDALGWADRLQALQRELERDINAAARARDGWEAATIRTPVLLERFRRKQYLADAVWVRLPPIKCIVDHLSGNSSGDPSPLPPPLLVAKPIRRSTSI